MGFFPKNAGSRLFNAGFAISDEDSKLIDIADELEKADEQNGGAERQGDLDVGCADIVHLLHSLPRKGNQTELHAIVKTFDVLGISLENLIAEAQRKEQLTTDRLQALDEEINRLNEELESRREESNMLNLGLEELHKLEESLQRMAELEAADQAEIAEEEKSNKAAVAEQEKASDEGDEAEPVAPGDAAYQLHGEDLVETQKVIDLDRPPKEISSSRKTRRRRKKSVEA